MFKEKCSFYLNEISRREHVVIFSQVKLMFQGFVHIALTASGISLEKYKAVFNNASCPVQSH